MKTIIATLFAATLSTTAFANEVTHNGQQVRDVAVKTENTQPSAFASTQGFVNNANQAVISADRGAFSGK